MTECVDVDKKEEPDADHDQVNIYARHAVEIVLTTGVI